MNAMHVALSNHLQYACLHLQYCPGLTHRVRFLTGVNIVMLLLIIRAIIMEFHKAHITGKF